jgi:DNA uptake protein ComE-like DNA-binding protein
MASKKVDLNTASLEELESLVGVGRAKAEAIIEARKVTTLNLLFFCLPQC